MSRVRILVVEDSLTVRRHLVEVLAREPDFEVVGEAESGERAIELCRALRPDIVTLDMILPGMSGLAVTEHIMAHFPTPILVVSASMNRGEVYKTYDALVAGAVDVIDKPKGNAIDDATWARALVGTVRVVSRIKVITHLRGKLGLRSSAPASPAPASASSLDRRLIAIGASTGGPGAVMQILEELGSSFSLPILLVVHIGAPFGQAFADWLQSQSGISVRYAIDGEPIPRAGTSGVYMAPPDFHLVLRGGRLVLTRDDPRHSCRPSIDVLFASVAEQAGASAVGCLLTGMGRDGAEGLLAMRRAGALTIAQDEATSVIFGMPREAIALQAAERVLPLGAIAPALKGLERGRTS